MKKILIFILLCCIFSVNVYCTPNPPSGYTFSETLSGYLSQKVFTTSVYLYFNSSYFIYDNISDQMIFSDYYPGFNDPCPFGVLLPAGNYGINNTTVDVYLPDQPDPPVITSATSVTKTAGSSFSYAITATGDNPITYGASGLPSYLTFNNDHTVSGTLPYSGVDYSFSFDVTATNAYGSDTKTVNVNVISGNSPVITSDASVSATSGQAFSYTITATGDPTIIYSTSGLPSYLNNNGSLVSGTLPASLTSGTFTFTVTATNNYGSDSKLITVNTASGNSSGEFDSDDDVPAINAMNTSVTNAINSFKTDFNHFYDTYDVYNATLDLRTSQIYDRLYNIFEVNTENLGQNIEINDKLSSIESLLSNIDLNQGSKIDGIKVVLDQQLAVQQDIRSLLQQIANPEPEPDPEYPEIEDITDPTSPEYNLDLEPDNVAPEREFKKFDKNFSKVENALRQRPTEIPFCIVLPFSSVHEDLEDKIINFGEAPYSDLLSAFRTVICAALYYFTLYLWVKCIRRITD